MNHPPPVPRLPPYNPFGHMSNAERFYVELNRRIFERHTKTWLETNPMRFQFKIWLTPAEQQQIKTQLETMGWAEIEFKQSNAGIRLALWAQPTTQTMPTVTFSDQLETWLSVKISSRTKRVIDLQALKSVDDFIARSKGFWINQPGIGAAYLKELQHLQYLAKLKFCATPAVQATPEEDIAWQHISKILT